MLTKLLLLLLLLVPSLFTFITASAQQIDREPNAKERVFQEAVDERTSPFAVHDRDHEHLGDIEVLLSAENISAEIKSNALARATSLGDVELLRLLIRYGADVNHQLEGGRTVLMIAAAGGFHVQCGNDPLVTSYIGNTEAVKALLDAGSRTDDQDREGNNALMLAAGYARSGSVQLLLKTGANINLTNAHGWTALMYAANSSGAYAEENLKEIVAALLASGANVNARDEQGKTALTYAAGSAAIKDMLIAAGAIE